MFKKNIKKILLTFVSLTASFSIVAPFVSHSLNSKNNIINNKLNASQTSISENDLVFKNDNRNNQQETSVGIVNVVDKKIIMTSYFNHKLWEYDLSANGSIIDSITGVNKSSIKDVKLKYNSFGNTIIVFGRVTASGTESNFLFQLNERTGTLYRINQNNNNNNGAILAGSQLTTSINNRSDQIFDLLINPNNGVITVFTKDNNLSERENTELKKISSVTYDQFVVKFDGLTNGNFDQDSSATMQALFNINENYWGFTYFYKGTSSSDDSYQYYIFDYNFKFVAKTQKTTISNSNTNNNKFTNMNYNETIAKPIIIPNSNNSSFYIVDASVIPITNSSYTDNGVSGSNKFRLWKFNPSDTNNKLQDFSSNQTDFSFSGKNYSMYSFKYDKNNKSIHTVIYELKEENSKFKVDFTKYSYQTWKIDEAQNKVVVANKFSVTTSTTNKKTIVNFGFVNSPNVVDNKTWIIFQKAIYDNTTLESIEFKRGSYSVGNNNSPTITFSDEWKKIVINDYKSAANSTTSKSKLPQDVPENEILDWVRLSYELDQNTEITDYSLSKTLETLQNENGYTLSDNENVLFNDTNGNLKVKIKISFDKWWKSNEKESFNIDISSTGFGTTSGLSFDLVTSSSVDSAKWTKIQELKKTKKPSELTQDDIFNNFIKKGTSLSLTKDNIAISASTQKDTTNTNLINVTTNDTKGSILVVYDLTSISSSSMSAENVIGKYEFTGFKNVTQYTPITLNEEKFNALKANRLAYQFTIEDVVACLDKSSIYNDMSKWKLVYTDSENSDSYFDNLIQGKTSFTIEYTRDTNIPSDIPDTSLKVTISKDDKGSGCKKLEEIIGTSITYDAETLLSLTGNMKLSEVNDNIQTLLRKSINIKNDWFNISTEIIPEYDSSSPPKQATYNLKYKDDKIISRILVTSNGINFKSLEFNKAFRNRITANSTTAKLFDLTKVIIKYDLIEYNWNYGISNNELVPQVSINYLIDKVNNDRIQDGLEPFKKDTIFPTVFSESFKNTLLFNEYFPLLKPVYKSILFNDAANNEQHFDILNIELVPNDLLGILNVRYTINYPNLGSKEGIVEKPEIIIFDFKTTKSTTNNYIILLIVIFSIIGIIILVIPALLVLKRYKYINSKGFSRKRNLSKEIKNKVIFNKNKIKELEIKNNSIDDLVSENISNSINVKIDNQKETVINQNKLINLDNEKENLDTSVSNNVDKLTTNSNNLVGNINKKELEEKNKKDIDDNLDIKEYEI